MSSYRDAAVALFNLVWELSDVYSEGDDEIPVPDGWWDRWYQAYRLFRGAEAEERADSAGAGERHAV